uniref:MATH domain-containing protein n=1 Tax=Nelumbo nucifera TaxID=4432 RepID=A0A822YMZ5_NELNU|nr:TPA_asm: hypothetical protein HUJ06_004620 [Nelumbo nucifera]
MDNQHGTRRTFRKDKPIHYTFKIQSFSSLSKNSIDKWNSCDFEVGGYKWKLSLHPKGNKNKGVKDHLSLYLAVAETSSLPSDWEVKVIFKLFLYDQLRDKYLMLEDADGRVRRFHGMKTEWGFDQFLQLAVFHDSSFGYLVDDTCVFGVEIFVMKNTGKGECLSLIKQTSPSTYTWKIEHFSQLVNEIYYSEEFVAEDYKWKILVYPKGYGLRKDNSLSAFMSLTNSATLSSSKEVYVKCKLRVVNQLDGKHIEKALNLQKYVSTTSNWGWFDVVSLNDLKDPKKGFLVNDTCILEAEVTIIAVVDKMS